jgi:hypothetical protein
MPLTLALGGSRCQILVPQRDRLAPPCVPFLVPSAPPEHDLRLALTAAPTAGRAGRRLPLSVERRTRGLAFHRLGRTMLATSACDEFLAPRSADGVVTGRPWLMLALWAHLTLRQGAFLHGALALVDGHLVALLGSPDAGKTTLSRLITASGQYTLSDEHVFVRRQPDGIWGYGSPWPGLPAGLPSSEGPLAAVFCLRQSPVHRVARLSETAALRRLIPVTWFLNDLSETIPLTMALLSEIMATVPVYELAFAPDAGAVEAIRGAL